MRSWPEKFLSEIQEILKEEYDAFLAAMERESAHAMRLNPLRKDAEDCARPFMRGDSVLWEENGKYVRLGARPGASLAHAAGAFYMQDPSAMSPVAVLNPKPGERVLDLCAAPGGKSGQIAGRMMGKGFLLSNEIEFSRARILLGNLERLGFLNTCITSCDANALANALPGFFDAVLVDAPCSGEGIFRRDPNAVLEWSENAPFGCAERQAEILDNAAKLLRPGGRMVYSTCTFNRYENEKTIEAFLSRHPEFEAGEFTLAGVGRSVNGSIRLWPHKIDGEGHFAALLIKTDGKDGKYPVNSETKGADSARMLLEKDAFCGNFDGVFHFGGDQLSLLPAEAPDIRLLSGKGVRLLRAGLPLCKVGKGFVVPDHALAMAMRTEDAGRVFDMDEATAAKFMEGEEIAAEAEKGWTLMTYKNMPLGWGKASQGAIKNHLPKGLRRRNAHWSEME
ncbi:MAG: RsmF rRNA methyltransferase first C-terminal domain-containing protein [Clostridia bacterium]|nr:RsmF rRNA methyltransferase first C-terminal domain-containing protein [Clostridia bacterium]